MTEGPPAGWYRDPLDSAFRRFWDGATWTEHTGPHPAQDAGAHHPAAHHPAPHHPSTQQPFTQQPLTQQPFTQQPFTQQPGGLQPLGREPVTRHPALSDPYRAPVAPGWYGPPVRRRSIATRELIGVGITVGVLLVLVVLAAIAIPVFLRTHQDPAAEAATTIDLPEAVLGLHQLHTPTSRRQVATLMSAQTPGQHYATVYGTATGEERALVLIGRNPMSSFGQEAFVRGADAEERRLGATGGHHIDPGPLGGRMSCATRHRGGTVCNFADAAAYGNINVFGVDGEQQAVALRGAVEHRRPTT